jgi:hypothetical protein
LLEINEKFSFCICLIFYFCCRFLPLFSVVFIWVRALGLSPPTVFVGRNRALVSIPLAVAQLFFCSLSLFPARRSAPLNLLRVSSFLARGLAPAELAPIFSRILAQLDSPLATRWRGPLLPHRSILVAAGFCCRVRFWCWFLVRLCVEPSFLLVVFCSARRSPPVAGSRPSRAPDFLRWFSLPSRLIFRSQLLALIFPPPVGSLVVALHFRGWSGWDFGSCSHRFWSVRPSACFDLFFCSVLPGQAFPRLTRFSSWVGGLGTSRSRHVLIFCLI